MKAMIHQQDNRTFSVLDYKMWNVALTNQQIEAL